MRFSLVLASAGLFAGSVLASPERMETVLKKRADAPNDVQILNYALVLEYLERDFYTQGLAKFNKAAFKQAGHSGKEYERIKQIQQQEVTHVSFLSGALGAAAVGECKYNFPLNDVDTFLFVAKVFEGVGVSAYLGAAPFISNKDYLAAAGSILTVEARHSSYLNEVRDISGFPTPYDAGLEFSQVYTLVSPFIVPGSCKGNGSLPPGIQAYPSLTVKSAKPRAGKPIGLHFPLKSGYNGPYYAAFIQSNQVLFAEIDKTRGVARTPSGLSTGIVYIVVTTSAEKPTTANTFAGPAYAFIN